MIIDKLKESMEIKNYKILCELIDEPVKSGNTKIAQLKELERFVKYHKSGNKFIIEQIYDIPLEKEDNRSNGNNSIYAEDIEKLIIHMCCLTDESKYKKIELSTNGLLINLKMINENYSVGRNNINKLSRYLEVTTETLFDFFNSTHKKNKDLIENSLNKLQDKCLIHWETIIKVCTKYNNYRKATKREIEGIKELECEALQKLGYETKQEVFLKGKWNSFANEVNARLFELMELKYYFNAYQIITTKYFREMLLDYKMGQLEDEELENIQFTLNRNVYDSAINSAEKRHLKVIETGGYSKSLKGKWFGLPKYDRDKNRLNDFYVEDTKKVANICIDMMIEGYLNQALKDIEGDKKYTYKNLEDDMFIRLLG